jgi:lysophospholipase L1-like esterase
MAERGLAVPRLTLWRLLWWTLVLIPIVSLGVIAVFWIESVTPEWVFWQIGLGFLIVVESAVGLAAALALAGAIACGALLGLRFYRRANLAAAARGLLLSLSVVGALGVAEAACVVWQARHRRGTAVPAGGLRDREAGDEPLHVTALPAVDQFPSRFPESADDRQIGILVLGESSAEGVPLSRWVSVGSMIRWKLKEVFPGRPVWLDVFATSRETLEIQQDRIQWLKRRPDLVIIYCGHNEFSSRFPHWRNRLYYFDDTLPDTWSLFVGRVESRVAFLGLIRENIEKCRIAIPPGAGSRALIDAPGYTTTEYTALLVDFRRRLDLLVSYFEKLGAVVILIAPAANDAGFEPNRSFLPAATPRQAREAFERDLHGAITRELVDPAGATAAYRRLLARQPGCAEAHYRVAQRLEAEGAWQEAYEHFTEARDRDGYPMRALTAFQDAYHHIAAGHRSVLIDCQRYFHAIGRHGLLDDFLFQDGIHPSLRGQIALAQRVLQALRERRAFGWSEDAAAPVIDPAVVVKEFGLGRAAWREVCLWCMMFYDLTCGLRYDPSQRQQKKVVLAEAVERLERGEFPEALGLPNVGTPAAVPLVDSDWSD